MKFDEIKQKLLLEALVCPLKAIFSAPKGMTCFPVWNEYEPKSGKFYPCLLIPSSLFNQWSLQMCLSEYNNSYSFANRCGYLKRSLCKIHLGETFLKDGNYARLFLFKNRLKCFWRIMFLASPTFAIPVRKSTGAPGCTHAIYGMPCQRLPETRSNKKLL